MGRTYQTSDFRNGLKIEVDGAPYEVVYFQFVKPGKGTAFTRTKLKNMLTGNVLERTYRTGETLAAAEVEIEPMQYLYNDADYFHFMNEETFEQLGIPREKLEVSGDFLTESLKVDVLFHKGNPMSVTLPNFIESEVTYCEPGVRGNTAQGATKPATLETGLVVQVPLFVKEGEAIRVDSRTGKYMERAKK